MTKKILVALLLQLTTFLFAFAQTTTAAPTMADTFRQDGKIYVVIAVAGVILTGIVIFLIMLERKIKRLEEKSKA